MAEEHKDGFAETVDTAASAAHTVKGAIKAGKAISSAAKGAAAGGPFGADAGAVWAGRKHGPVCSDAAWIDFRRLAQCLFAVGHETAYPQ